MTKPIFCEVNKACYYKPTKVLFLMLPTPIKHQNRKEKIPSINWEIKDSVSPEFQREDTVHNFCITVAEFQNCI